MRVYLISRRKRIKRKILLEIRTIRCPKENRYKNVMWVIEEKKEKNKGIENEMKQKGLEGNLLKWKTMKED